MDWLSLIFLLAFLFFLPLASANNDMQVWRGQYYKGSIFQVGTFEVNFSVYDHSVNGTLCYSNISSITTGVFGEWRTEQWVVGTACSDSSKDYYLEISVNGEKQGSRRLLKSFNYIRKDIIEEVKGLKIKEKLEGNNDTLFYDQVKIFSQGKSSQIYLRNDVNTTLLLTLSNNGSSSASCTNCGELSYDGDTNFFFTASEKAASWVWRKVSTSGKFDTLAELTSEGSVVISHGDISINGSINVTKDVIAQRNMVGKNLTGSLGLFDFLGSVQQRVKTIFAATADFNETLTIRDVNVTGKMSARNITVIKVFVDNIDVMGTLVGSGNINISGNINTTNSIKATGDITATNGFFTFMGGSTNRITKLWAQDIDASKDIIVGRNLQVLGNLEMGGGNLEINGSLEVTGNVGVSGNLEIGKNLEVAGCIEFNGGSLGVCLPK